ncbi:hypothetical protein HPB49_012296 [Dermacentor silvarum]|uniref:Uncharacterized protein n=1 Tax=Dermacentor silvarum TaxID=543639 RepID=A0ACB8E0C6_DERSI|nr:hypothetical protein HPB49_012296 [Dermacentor silvarum]
MKANFAFPLFSAEVLRGLFFYKNEISKRWSDPAPTQAFVLMMVKLIEAMTASIPSKGKNITDLLEYLNKWEASVDTSKLGFISASTTESPCTLLWDIYSVRKLVSSTSSQADSAKTA